MQGCDITIGSYNTGELSTKCKYLMERTKYANSTSSAEGLLLETAINIQGIWNVYSRNRYLSAYGPTSLYAGGARPVIEVPKASIDY